MGKGAPRRLRCVISIARLVGPTRDPSTSVRGYSSVSSQPEKHSRGWGGLVAAHQRRGRWRAVEDPTANGLGLDRRRPGADDGAVLYGGQRGGLAAIDRVIDARVRRGRR